MNTYTVNLMTSKVEHTISIDVEAENFGEAEKTARKEYEWAGPLTVKCVILNEEPTADKKDRIQYLPLTEQQKSNLFSFLSMSAGYRHKELKVWEELSQEEEKDGTPKFPNAKNNAVFWSDMIESLIGIEACISGISPQRMRKIEYPVK